jgi:hypothetical protein
MDIRFYMQIFQSVKKYDFIMRIHNWENYIKMLHIKV